MQNTWTQEKIEKILPQGYPFLFIDKVVEADTDKAVCVKNFTINEHFLTGHFPGKPLVPGVIIIEAMAQAGIILYAACRPEPAAAKPDYFLGKVEARFKNPVYAGDRLILEVRRQKITDKAGIIIAQARVDDKLAASASIFLGIKPRTGK